MFVSLQSECTFFKVVLCCCIAARQKDFYNEMLRFWRSCDHRHLTDLSGMVQSFFFHACSVNNKQCHQSLPLAGVSSCTCPMKERVYPKRCHLGSIFFMCLQFLYNFVILSVHTIIYYVGLFCTHNIDCMSICSGKGIHPLLLFLTFLPFSAC